MCVTEQNIVVAVALTHMTDFKDHINRFVKLCAFK